jgi:hypothetical protein
MKKRIIEVTLDELYNLTEKIEDTFDNGSSSYHTDDYKRFRINMDTWELLK